MDQAALQKAIQTSIDHTAVLLDAHRSLHDGKIPPELLPDLTAMRCTWEVEASTEEAVTLAAKEHIRSMDDLNLKNQLAALRCDAPKTAAEPAQQQQLVAAQPPTLANLFAHAKHTSTVLAATANHIATEKKEAVMHNVTEIKLTNEGSVERQRLASDRNQDSQNELFEKNAAAQSSSSRRFETRRAMRE